MAQIDDLVDAQLGGADAHARAWRIVDTLLAVAAAAIVAWGVLSGGWSVFAVMALYWVENVIIGVFNVVKMLFAGALGGLAAFVGTLFMVAFFCVHYGLFTAVHGFFVVMLFGREAGIVGGSGLFQPLGRMLGWLLASRDGVLAMLAIVSLHGVACVRWLMRRAAGEGAGENLFGAVYGRVMVLHVALIAGAGLTQALNAPRGGVLLLVALKLLYDLGVAWKRPKPAAAAGRAEAGGRRPPPAFITRERFRGRP